MKSITKKDFINRLCSNKSRFIVSTFRQSVFFIEKDEKIITFLDSVESEKLETLEQRTVIKAGAEYIQFNNDSYLYFNQIGKKEYFEHINPENIRFIIQKTITFDDFDGVYQNGYIIYNY